MGISRCLHTLKCAFCFETKLHRLTIDYTKLDPVYAQPPIKSPEAQKQSLKVTGKFRRLILQGFIRGIKYFFTPAGPS